jgi:hypothetical protein
MAITQFAFGLAPNTEAFQALDVDSVTAESIAPTTSNAATTAVAPSAIGTRKPLCRVATDTTVYVSFGSAPNATSDAKRFLCPAGVSFFFVKKGDKAAVATLA